ncbi:MAG TPA: hypothetical protein VNU26_10875 [Mycobacteriales bacterium]|nr:hypothetical protein [Mycobacteriales bacterium]
MTSVDTGRRDTHAEGGTEPLSSRLRRGGPLLVGAALVLLLLQPIGSLPLRGWVPVLIGLSYVAAGLLSGRRGLLLGPGIVIAGWGLAPMTVQYTGEEFNGMFYLTLGTGLLVAAILAQSGWSRITPMSLALPVLFIGGTMAIAPHVGRWLTTILAGLLAGWALWEMRPQSHDRAPATDRR